jgi:hypothetical protein
MLGVFGAHLDMHARAIKTYSSEYLYTLWWWRYGCEKGVVVDGAGNTASAVLSHATAM